MAAKKKATAKKGRRAARARTRASAVPAGFHTLTPHIVLDDCAKAMEFYKTAFGAKEKLRMPGPGGKIIHAEMAIGDSRIMMGDEMEPMGMPGVYKSPKNAGLSTAALFLYVRDVDKWYDRAIEAGCSVRLAPADMFWGDRFAQVIDPFGHTWGMATHTEDLTPKQMAQRQREAFAQMGEKK